MGSVTDGTRAKPPVPIASVRMAEDVLDELLSRIHTAEAFPSTVRLRFDVPTVGVAGAFMSFTLGRTRLHLRNADRNRPRLEVQMDGRIDWEFLLGRVGQKLDLRYEVLPPTDVVLVDAETVELRADFARARIEKVNVVIRETSYLPAGVTQELLGPLGRRFLDGFVGEAIRMFMRRLGNRDATIGAPLARWLTVLGVEPGSAAIAVGSGWVEVAFVESGVNPADTRIARELEHRFEGVDVGVTVAADRAARLLDFWTQEFEETAGGAFREARFNIEAGELNVSSEATVKTPVPLPSPSSHVDLMLDPQVADGVLHLEPVVKDLELPAGWGWLGRLFRGPINRGLARRMRVEVIWQLPVPISDGDWWQLSMEHLSIDSDAVRVKLGTWFPEPS